MKKILYVASSYGHIASFHIPYIMRLQEMGFDVHVAAGGGLDVVGQLACKKVFIPFEKRMASFNNVKCTVQLMGLLKRERYDVISVHTSLAAFFVRAAVRLSGKKNMKIINTVHGYLFDEQTPMLKRTIFLCAEKWTKSVTDMVVVMNRQDYDIAEKHRLYKDELIQIPGFGIDTERFYRKEVEEALRSRYQKEMAASSHINGEALSIGQNIETTEDMRQREREKLGFQAQDTILIYAAEFSKRKNQQMLIRAMSLLPKTVKLLLAGQGECLEACRQMVEHLELTNQVHFLGHVKNLEYYYFLSDICVSASRSEGLPFNIMEAMSMGLPVVATNVKGHEDLVEHGVNGYLYKFDEAQGFAEAVLQLMRNPDHARQISEDNVEKASEYGLEQVMESVLSVYIDI